MNRVPVDAKTPDWPRKIATAINALMGRTTYTGLGNYANDAAAATGGVEIGDLYRNGSVVMVRVS